MPESSYFTVVTDRAFEEPPPRERGEGWDSSLFIRGISLPGIDTSRRALLAFRVRVFGATALFMEFVGAEPCIDYAFRPEEPESTRPRTWHEVIPGTDLKEHGNDLRIAVIGTVGSYAEISDIVIFYRGPRTGTILDQEVPPT